MKLALGTAQFGLPYGIASGKQVEQSQVVSILKRATSAGIDTVDTAVTYGESETSLGEAGVTSFNVITKLPPIEESILGVSSWIEALVQESLERLRTDSLYGILLHTPSQLLESCGEEIWTSLHALKKGGKVKKVGYSLYAPTELDDLFERHTPDIVQVPYNIIDRRIETSGWMQRLSEEGVEIHVRSIFLQGLLLMSPGTRPKHFEYWSTLWSTWDSWLHEHDVSALETCLSFALQDERIQKVIVGVDSELQLNEILSASATKISEFPLELMSSDVELVQPSRWAVQ